MRISDWSSDVCSSDLLDEGLVTDAWPALGSRAKYQIDSLIRQSGERPEYGQIRGGPSQSSSIIMQIGDLRISEWSDNGSCRFWSDTDPGAPKLYAKVYDGGKLRTTSGRSDFERSEEHTSELQSLMRTS